MSALWSKSAGHICPPHGGSPIMGIIYIFLQAQHGAKEQHMEAKEQHMEAKEQHRDVMA